MLRSLKLEGFKAFESATVTLEPFTMLVGPNGAGKSTVLQAVDLLGGLVTSTISEFLQSHGWDYADLPHLRSSSTSIRVEAVLELSGEQIAWRFELGARRYPGVAREWVTVRRSGTGKAAGEEQDLLVREGRWMRRFDELERTYEGIEQTLPSSWLSALDARSDAKRFPTLVRLAQWARAIRGYFFLDPVRLRSPNRGKPDDVGRHGELLAPFLASLQRSNKDAYARVLKRVQKHYPHLAELHFKRTGYGWTSLEVTERRGKEAARFNARQVSDGLLRLLAVAAMHELPTPPSVLLLDEVENGLHPHLMQGLVEMLHEFVAAAPGQRQVLVTTHSPIAVNFAKKAEEVVIVDRDRKGRVKVTPLSEAHGFEELSQHFDLGELWYNAGEARLVR